MIVSLGYSLALSNQNLHFAQQHYQSKNQSFTAIIKTITTKKTFIKPSPFFTENRLANQAPLPLPIAKMRPIFQFTLSLYAKTASAAIIYKKTTATLVALERTKDILLT